MTMTSDNIAKDVIFWRSLGIAYTTCIKLKEMYTRLYILTSCIYNWFGHFNYSLETYFTDLA